MNNRLLSRLAAAGSLLAVLFFPSLTAGIATGPEKAWQILTNGLAGEVGDRVEAVAALGLVTNDAKAMKLVIEALDDEKPQVRIAACNTLAALNNKAAIPNLQKVLADKEITVVFAAAHALDALKDPSAYDIYYAVLTGEVKDSKGIIAKQLDTLKDPKQLAQIGFSEGIGFVPFAGMGWDAYRMLHKSDPSPVRAIAASVLAVDPDPKSADALVAAVQDKNWIVRVAALEALSRRGDTSLISKVEPAMADTKKKVRFTAAAVVVHLNDLKNVHPKRRRKEAPPKTHAW